MSAPSKKSKPPVGISRSEFIRKAIAENNEVSPKEIQQAWNDKGFPAKLQPSATLFYQVKSKSGKSRRVPSASSPPTKSDKTPSIFEIEQQLDNLIVLAREMKDAILTESLLVARRQVSKRILETS